MIKVKELSIGSICDVYPEVGENLMPLKAKVLDIEDIHNFIEGNVIISPIKLTREWVLKFKRFKKITEMLFKHISEDEWNSEIVLVWDIKLDCFKFAFQGNWYAIKEVHGLQHIFMSLGEELELID